MIVLIVLLITSLSYIGIAFLVNEKNAKYLNSKLDQKNMALPIPSAPAADQVSQWVLMQRFIENANDQKDGVEFIETQKINDVDKYKDIRAKIVDDEKKKKAS